jgi:hypothetical protein
MGPSHTLAAGGTMEGLPCQTLKPIEDYARDFIENSESWDAETMSAHISIYQVPNLYLLVRNMANAWQPKESDYKTYMDLVGLELTAEDLHKKFVQRPTKVELNQTISLLLIVFGPLI